MSPRSKKLIVIANIVVYTVICLGIYARRKGGWKSLVPGKKPSFEEVMAMKKKGAPVPGTSAAKAPVKKKPQVARAPAPRPVPRVRLPAYIAQTKELLEQMKVKEKTLRFRYYAGRHRDPFVPLIGIAEYLSRIKFTPDEMAELPYGLPEDGKRKASPFMLMGTIKSKRGESSVIINDRILHKGDIIDGYKVTDISQRKVTLKRGKKVIRLEIPLDESRSEAALSEGY